MQHPVENFGGTGAGAEGIGAMLDMVGVVISQSSSSLSTPTMATSSGTLIS
jgi:hypothetical protein